jgi:acetyl-CoA C-acetyltransferase
MRMGADHKVASMPLDPRLPVLIGAGQAVHHAAGLDDAWSPVDLMVDAARSAAVDAGLAALPRPDSVRAVSLLSWRYRDPARFVADALGIADVHTGLYDSGGNSPQDLLNHTAAQIQRGELDLALLVGGEAWRTRTRARKQGVDLGWPEVPDGVRPGDVYGGGMDISHPAEVAAGVRMPVQMYPMFETALRAEAGRPLAEHQAHLGELWSRFSDVAATNPYAWSRVARTASEISTPGPSNRMVGAPYPKLLNSNNDVDMGAAVLVCSVQRAMALGVPRDLWVFVHAGARAHEHLHVSNRASFTRTPAIELAGRTALELAGLSIDDVAIVDLYSCFPSAVQLGARSLGLGLDRQLTRTGGLTFGGGPWNNYVMHAIATVVADCRRQPGERALVWANGGFCTKHAFGVYSTQPPAAGFRHEDVQPAVDDMPRADVVADHVGPATIEGYTVIHGRDGMPDRAYAACRTPDGRRAWASTGDAAAMVSMVTSEWVGQAVELKAGELRRS